MSVCPRLCDGGRHRSRGETRVHQNSVLFVQGRLGTLFSPAGSDVITSSRHKTWSHGCHAIIFPHTWVNKILTPFVSSQTCGPQNDSVASALVHGAEPGLVRGQRTKRSSLVSSALTRLPEGQVWVRNNPEGWGMRKAFICGFEWHGVTPSSRFTFLVRQIFK